MALTRTHARTHAHTHTHTHTHTHLATLLLSPSGETPSGTFLLLFYIASSPSQSPHIPRFTPSFQCSFVGGGGCGVGLCHVECVLIRGGHSVTWAGGVWR